MLSPGRNSRWRLRLALSSCSRTKKQQQQGNSSLSKETGDGLACPDPGAVHHTMPQQLVNLQHKHVSAHVIMDSSEQ